MIRIVAALILLGAAAPASAVNRANLSPGEMARAFNAWSKAVNPASHKEVAPGDVCVGQCIGPDEEPTEFECRWQLRTSRGWERRTNWLAVDGKGWHIIGGRALEPSRSSP